MLLQFFSKQKDVFGLDLTKMNHVPQKPVSGTKYTPRR